MSLLFITVDEDPVLKWQNLTLDDIYDPTFQYYSRWFTDIAFVITLIYYILTVYVITKASTSEMKVFELELICQLTGNFAIEVLIFVMHPAFLYPFPFVTSNTYLPASFQQFHLSVGVAAFLLGMALNAIIALTTSLAYRVYAIFNTHVVKLSTKVIVFMAVCQTCLAICVFCAAGSKFVSFVNEWERDRVICDLFRVRIRFA